MLTSKTLSKRIISLVMTFLLVLSISVSSGFMQIAQAEGTITDGLQVWYKFDETSGTVAKDSSGNGFDGTLMGGAGWDQVDGQGVGLNLENGQGDAKYVDVPTDVMADVPGDFTITTWIKVNSAGVWSRIIDYGTTTSNVMMWTANSYFFKMDNDDAKGIDPPRNGTVPGFMVGCPASVLWPEGYSAPRWQYATITRKGNTTTLWVDGIRWASREYTSNNPRTSDDYKFYIGKSLWAADPYPNMNMRDFRIYNRALSINEINQLMLEGDYSDELQVKYAIDLVELPETTDENLYLPDIVNDKVDVTWASDNPAIEANKRVGVVNRPEAGSEAVTVNITGTFTYGEYSEDKTYTVTVQPKGESDPVYTMNVDADNPSNEMSSTMYGLFFEDLSNAGDGGLYAELLRNTCFHDDMNSIPYWDLIQSDGSSGNMSLNKTNNLNDVQFQHLKLDILSLGENGYVGIHNAGYNGMEFVEGEAYNLSFFARTDDFAGAVNAALITPTGEVISQPVKVENLTSDWQKYELTLYADQDAAQGEFILYCTGGTGSVYLDVVSLIPENTYEGKFRVDMVDMLKDMNPTFLRFPGGCYVEGATMADAFRWKNTLGDKEDRAGHPSLWNYRVTDNLGYYEFLQLSELLDCEPLYVCGVGIAHGDNEDWQYWVQDVLDAIEFANGDVTTEWGAVRAQMGHPEPFNMKYVEIGNEANMQAPLYTERYQDFYDAIKAEYPYMNIIANMDIADRDIDIVDEHYYSYGNPNLFVDNAYKYDSYSDKYEVYVGEYGTNTDHGLQNLKAALDEAAFMTGMERNSDIVTMTSYSELFANLNHQNWNANAAFFDSSRIYGTPSYYNQVIFGEHVGDVVLPTTFTDSSSMVDTDIKGRIGLGAWNTNITYSNVKLTSNIDGTVLFEDDFDDLSAWTTGTGAWSVSDGKLQQTAILGDCRIWTGDPNWSNYTYEFTARKNSGSEGFLIMVGQQDSDNFYWINLGGWNNERSNIEKTKNGVKYEVAQSIPGGFEANRDYNIKVVVDGNNIKCYVDGDLMFDYTDYEEIDCPLYYVSQRDNMTGDVILKVVNTSDSDYNTNIKLNGANGVASEATATILTSASILDENSFNNGENVAPVTIPVTNVSDDFNYTFMRNSVTVLVIPTQDKPYLNNVEIDKAEISRSSEQSLKAGDTEQINLSVSTVGGDTKLDGAKISYFSGDTSLGIIDNTGKLTIASDIGDAKSLKIWAQISYKKQIVSTNELIIPLGDGDIPVPEISITTDKQSYAQNSPITVTVTAPDNIIDLSFVNEYGLDMGKSLIDVVSNDNGTATWTFITQIASKGQRTITVLGNGESIGTFDVIINSGDQAVDPDSSADIISAKSDSIIVLTGQNFNITVVTGKGCSNIAFENEYGADLGKALVSKEVKGDTIEWVYSMNIGSKGLRTITVKSADADGNYLDKTTNIKITVVK